MQFRMIGRLLFFATPLMFLAFAQNTSAQSGVSPGKPEFSNKGGQAPIEKPVLEEIRTKGQSTCWVVLREQADLRPAHRMWNWHARGAFVHEKLSGVADRTQRSLRQLLRNRGANFKPVWIVNAIHVTADQATLEQIAARPEVKEIIAVRTYSIPRPIQGTPQSSINGVEWGVERINAPLVWTGCGTRGEGMVVCNIDTGVQYDHPALVNQYRGNQGGGSFDHNYNWYDPSSVCSSPSLAPCDNNGHGTHTMGTMVGDDGAGNQIGVAPGAHWIAAKGCESDSCSGDALTACAQWILAPTDLNGQNPRPDLRPNIVNNSWGGGQHDPWYQSLIQAWVAAGIWPSFSVGNSGSSCWTANSPGDYPESYAAGAFDYYGQIAWFSSRGPSYFTLDGANIIKPNITAPGVDVRSSVPYGDGYDWYSGTSMASPHVAGTVALLWSASPALVGDIANTRALLDQTASDTDDTSCGGTAANNNIWGEGRLDIFAAVSQAPKGEVGALRGTVTDAGTGMPVSGVTVQAVGPLNRTTFTGPDGSYEFPILTVGSYGLTASFFGYVDQTINDVAVQKDQATVQDIALPALPRHSISGTIFDGGTMLPLPGASIAVLNTPILPATSDANGNYTITQIPEGSYDVLATASCCNDPVMQHLNVTMDASGVNFTLPRRADAFGYYCQVVPPAYVELDTPALPMGSDYSSCKVQLPFPFTFYGQTYSEAWVSTSGLLTFLEERSWVPSNELIPTSGTPNAAIYVFWRYIWIDPAFGVRTNCFGDAGKRQFVVEWRNAYWEMDFELVLNEEDGSIVTQYRDIRDAPDFRGVGATIGLENESGGIAFLYSYDQPSLPPSQFGIQYKLPPMAFIEGQVTDANDGLPIAGATVRLLNADGTAMRELKPNAEGLYRTQAPLGQYTIQATAVRYAPASFPVGLETQNATYVQNFQLQAAGIVVSPASLSFTVPSGQSQAQPLSLRNNGSLDLIWQIAEGSAFSTDFNSGPPPGTSLYGGAYIGSDGGADNTPALRLTDAYVYWARGLWVIDNPVPSTAGFKATFKALIGNGDGADGMSFNFAGEIPDVYSRDWEEGAGTGLAVCFDTYDNGGGEAPAIDVKVDGQILAWQPMDPWLLRPGIFVDVSIEVTPQQTLTLTAGGQTVFSDVAVPGLPASGRFALGARTGGLSDNHWIDDLSIRIGQGEVPWLSEGPLSGTLSSGEYADIQVTVDASALDTGAHNATLIIFNNSGREPALEVPVTVTVTGPYLRGTVTNFNTGLPVEGATVRVYREGTLIRTLTTDSAGAYQTRFPLGKRSSINNVYKL